jgi:hypothetical protein
MIDWLDGDLASFDEATGDILRVYTRPPAQPRAEYRYMCEKAIEFQDWEKAQGEWAKLPTDKKQNFDLKVQMEFQNWNDIRTGLLATLSDYRGFSGIKTQFSDAIRSVEFK